MLLIQGLSKSFGKKAILQGIELSAREGEVMCLVGPNGSGKTTLLKILAGLVLPDRGSVQIGAAKNSKSAIGISLSEERGFYGRLSGWENLRFFAALHGILGKAFEARVAQIQDLFPLEDLLKPVFQRFSSGMKQRLSLARALLHDPLILLLDEPTKSLDPEMALAVRNIVRLTFAEKSGKAILWATHNLAEAWKVAHRLAILSKGKVAASGAPQEISKNFPGKSPEEIYLSVMREGDAPGKDRRIDLP